MTGIVVPAADEIDPLRNANIELVRRFIAALNDSWNIAAMRELVSADFLFEVPFAPDWYRVRHLGRDHALAFLDSVRDLMEPENLHAVEIATLHEDPGEILAHYRSDTRIRITGMPYRNRYLGRFSVREGRITRFLEFLDPIVFVLAIGGRVEPPAGF